MADELFQGYKGRALETLKGFNVRVWSQVNISSTRGDFRGTVLPRAENEDDKHIVLKIPSGYNVGVNVETITGMQETGYQKANYKIPEKEFPYSPNLPNVKLFGTGGTIASRLDYRTGAVIQPSPRVNYTGQCLNWHRSVTCAQRSFLLFSVKIWDPTSI